MHCCCDPQQRANSAKEQHEWCPFTQPVPALLQDGLRHWQNAACHAAQQPYIAAAAAAAAQHVDLGVSRLTLHCDKVEEDSTLQHCTCEMGFVLVPCYSS
jgi:hypothetical protein